MDFFHNYKIERIGGPQNYEQRHKQFQEMMSLATKFFDENKLGDDEEAQPDGQDRPEMTMTQNKNTSQPQPQVNVAEKKNINVAQIDSFTPANRSDNPRTKPETPSPMMAPANPPNQSRRNFATFNEMKKPSFLSNSDEEEEERKANEVLFKSLDQQESFFNFNFSVPSISKQDIGDASDFQKDAHLAFDDFRFSLKSEKKVKE